MTVTTITPIPPNPPLNNITPFTYRDGYTYLELFEALRAWINDTVIPGVNDNFDSLVQMYLANLEQIIENNNLAIDQIIADNDATVAQILADQAAFESNIQAIVDGINNRSGMLEVQHVTAAGQELVIDPAWPTNLPFYWEVTQPVGGNETVTFSGDFTGQVVINPTPGSRTLVEALPLGDGTWRVRVLDSDVNQSRREVPLYLAASGTVPPHEYNHALCLYNESSTGMANIRRILGNARAGIQRAHIMFIGDSKTEGAGAGVLSAIPRRVQEAWGARERISFAWHTYFLDDPDTRWVIDRFTRPNFFTPYLEASADGVSTATFFMDQPATDLRVWYRPVGAWTGDVTVRIDGGAFIPVTVDGTSTPPGANTAWSYFDVSGLSNANHEVEIQATNDNSGKDFFLLGVETRITDHDLWVSNAGAYGSDILRWMPGGGNLNAWTLPNATAGLFSLEPNMGKIAVIQLGTNVYDNVEEAAKFVEFFNLIESLGWAPLLVVPGVTSLSPADDRMTNKLRVYEAADTHDWPLIDFSDLVGDFNTASQGDYVSTSPHENQRGYSYEASAIIAALA